MTTDLFSRISTEEEDEDAFKPVTLKAGGGTKYNPFANVEEKEESTKTKKPKRLNGYHTVDMQDEDEEDEGMKAGTNPFDALDANFEAEQDPLQYVEVYKHIKTDMQSIDDSIREVVAIRDRFLLSVTQQEYESTMNKLEQIMRHNSKLTLKIKNSLQEEKSKNDKLAAAEDHRCSSILQCRINELNSCAARFQCVVANFEQQLVRTQNKLKEKERRKLRQFDEGNELTEEEREHMIEHPEQLNSFLQKKWEGMSVADATLDRIQELEDTHKRMLQIERSIQELHGLLVELNVMVTEQQERLDMIETNVQETKGYMEKATKNLKSAEVHQHKARKYACCIACFLLVVVVLLIVFVGGFIKVKT